MGVKQNQMNILKINNAEDLKRKINEGINSNLNHKHKEYDFMLEQIWKIFFEATRALQNCIGAYVTPLSERENTIFKIYENCLIDAHAAVHVLRSGFDRSAAIIIRGMLENLALAIALTEDKSDEIFNQYVKGEYNIPKAVSIASKTFKYIGRIYGDLTNFYVHENYNSLGRTFRKDGLPLEIPSVGNNDFLVEAILLSELGLIIETLGQAAEASFCHKVRPSIFLDSERTDKGHRVKDNTPARTAFLMLYQCRVERLGGGLTAKIKEDEPKT